MMSKLTKKRQVTLPAAIRRVSGLQPGAEVEFAALPDRKAVMQRMLRPISHKRAQELMEERTRKALNHQQPDAEKTSD